MTQECKRAAHVVFLNAPADAPAVVPLERAGKTKIETRPACFLQIGDIKIAGYSAAFKEQQQEQDMIGFNKSALKPQVWIADGGLAHFNSLAFVGSKVTWMGDGDSLSAQDALRLEKNVAELAMFQQVKLEANKNFSDGAAVFDAIFNVTLQEQPKTCGGGAPVFPVVVEVHGGLGGRRDHEWVNVLEAGRFVQRLGQPSAVVFVGQNSGCVVSSASFCLEVDPGHVFTIVDLNQVLRSGGNDVSVEVAGARYNGRLTFERPSHGLSNESCSPKVEIQVRHQHSQHQAMGTETENALRGCVLTYY